MRTTGGGWLLVAAAGAFLAGSASAEDTVSRPAPRVPGAASADMARAERSADADRTFRDEDALRRRAELAALDLVAEAPDASAAIEAYARARTIVRRTPFAAKAYVRRMTELGLADLVVRQARDVLDVEMDEPLARAVVAAAKAREGDAEGAMTGIARAVMHDPDEPFVRRTAGRIAAWRATREGRMAADVETMFERVQATVGATPEYRDAYDAALAAYAKVRADAQRAADAEAATAKAIAVKAKDASDRAAADPAAAATITVHAILIDDAVAADYRADGLNDTNLYYGTPAACGPTYVVRSWGCGPVQRYVRYSTSLNYCAPPVTSRARRPWVSSRVRAPTRSYRTGGRDRVCR